MVLWKLNLVKASQIKIKVQTQVGCAGKCGCTKYS